MWLSACSWICFLTYSANATANQDVFYSEISETSEDYPFIRTECVIDTVQATTYLMEAIVNLYRAIDQRGQRCGTVGLGGSDVGCAINVIGFITCLSWVAAYLSLAASACAQAVNPGALCVADWMTITGAFGEIAYAGAGARRYRKFDIALCVADAFQEVAWTNSGGAGGETGGQQLSRAGSTTIHHDPPFSSIMMA
eukprot:Skav230253  [mRNA]  locus=scaffold1520:104582:105963:+ [translate_table: standard]